MRRVPARAVNARPTDGDGTGRVKIRPATIHLCAGSGSGSRVGR
jgi:hypothetical protein